MIQNLALRLTINLS